MNVARGNRKLATLAMGLTSMTAGVSFLACISASETIVGSFVAGVLGLCGTTIWGNVATHKVQAGQPMQ